MSKIAVVSVNDSYHEGITLSELEPYVYGFWGLTLSACEGIEAVLAVKSGVVVGAWQCRGAMLDENHLWGPDTHLKKRVKFMLGEPLVVSPTWHEEIKDVNMRRGSSVYESAVVLPGIR